MDNIRILHCIYSLSGGGAETQLNLLCNHSIANNMQTNVLCVSTKGNKYSNEYFNKNIKFISSSIIYPIKYFITLCKHIDEFKPNIVHAWIPPTISGPALFAAKLKGVKAVASYRRTMTFDGYKRYFEFISILLFANNVISNNDVSHHSFLFRWLFNLKKGSVISNGVEIDSRHKENYFKTETRDSLKLIFVGRLNKEKNWEMMIKSLSKIRRLKWELDIFGEGEDKKQIEDMILKLNLNGMISLKGFAHDIHEKMTNYDLLILPSWCEGLPNVVAEAMVIGLPCAVSDIPAHRNILNEHEAIFFDPSDIESLANIIGRVLTGKIFLNSYAKNASKRAHIFNPNSYAKNYFDAYTILIKT